MYSSIRWSSWYHLRSIINMKQGNTTAAIQDLDAACKGSEAQVEESRLLLTGDLSRAAYLKILLGDAESVCCFPHDVQPLLCIICEIAAIDKEAVGGESAAPDPSPELMKGRQTEALCMLYDHASRLRDINPHLYDRCRDKVLQLLLPE